MILALTAQLRHGVLDLEQTEQSAEEMPLRKARHAGSWYSDNRKILCFCYGDQVCIKL